MEDGNEKFGGTVLLLRSAKKADEYHDAITSKCHVKVFSIPVLDFSFKNLEALEANLFEIEKYSGLILTSPRSAQALSRSLESIDVNSNEAFKATLENVRVFVVGKATEQASVKAFEKAGILLKTCEGGSEGSAEKLANFILKHESIQADRRPLLFLCGNIAKEILPNILRNSNIDLISLCVYDTLPHPNFRENFNDFLATYGDPKAVVFFSPSGAEFYLNEMEEMVTSFQQIKIITIGQTTAKYFHEQKYHVHGVSEKPNAESLSQIITDVLNQAENADCS